MREKEENRRTQESFVGNLKKKKYYLMRENEKGGVCLGAESCVQFWIC